MKILFLIHKLTYSGAPRIMVWLANSFAQCGHEVELIAFFGTDNLLKVDSRVKLKQYGVRQSPSRLIRNTVQATFIVDKINKDIDVFKPDLVLSFLDSISYHFIRKNKTRSYKMVVSERSDPYSRKGHSSKVKKQIIESCDAFVFQTRNAADYYNLVNKNYAIIPNPIRNTETIELKGYDYRKRPNTIISIGRLDNVQKRYDVLINAFAIISRKHPEYDLKIYGDGRDKEDILAMVHRLGLDSKVILCGRTDNVFAALSTGKLFAMSSDYEGIPNTLIEALQAALPCVTTDCSPGGARVLINDGVNGYIVPKGDIDTLANRILELIENEKICLNFSQNATCLIEDYTEDKIYSRWEEFFRMVISDEE